MNPMNPTRFGFHWKYNVCQGDTPIPSMGRVYYVVDSFGNLVMTDSAQINASLA